MKRLIPAETTVMLIDIQERLASAMPDDTLAQVVRSGRILLEAARRLGSAVIVTEQYPRGLGATLPDLKAAAEQASASVYEKTSFSALDVEPIASELEAAQPRAVVVIGMESHVCVFQTVRDLTDRGFEVHVPLDGVSSRREDHRRSGLQLCQRAGAIETTTESVVFDWLRGAGGDDFKALSKMIR